MTSRPLFISVAESTEIFGPIDHFGCAIACAGVTSASSRGCGRGTARPTRSAGCDAGVPMHVRSAAEYLSAMRSLEQRVQRASSGEKTGPGSRASR